MLDSSSAGLDAAATRVTLGLRPDSTEGLGGGASGTSRRSQFAPHCPRLLLTFVPGEPLHRCRRDHSVQSLRRQTPLFAAPVSRAAASGLSRTVTQPTGPLGRNSVSLVWMPIT